ncbi:MAG: ABC transporter ATP-binding protein, partial [Alloprevotella sp.]
MKTELLHICDLSTGYGKAGRHQPVAAGLNGSLPRATLTALIGPNGAGKSTLLRTLAGLQPALAGQVELDGQPLAAYTPRALARTVGIVLTKRVEALHLSVRQVVEAGRMPYTGLTGRLTSADTHAVEHAMELTRTTGFADRMIHTLSDGERQRVMIAKALAQDTPLILLDEPTAFLDVRGKVELLELLRQLVRSCGRTILLSSHDVELMLAHADRLWLLQGSTASDAPNARSSGSII